MIAVAHRSLSLCIFFLCIFHAHSLLAADYGSLLKKAPAREVSALAVTLDTRELFSLNPHLPLKPASILKLLVSYEALKTFHPEHTFSTDFFVDNRNNLYVRGGGDPTLTTEQVYLAAAELRRRGVTRVMDIVLDDSRFHSGERKGARAYEASSHALSFNFNSARIWVCTDQKGTLRKGIDPESFARYVSDIPALAAPARGNCTSVYRSVEDVPRYFGVVLRAHLEQAGIGSQGAIRAAAVPDEAALVYTIASRPVAEIVAGLNHFSTNMIAEMLLRSLGCDDTPCSASQGLATLKKRLIGLGVSEQEYVLEDASGLSHGNRISSRALILILRAALMDPEIAPEYLSSLSTLGRSGTLKSRDGDALFRGKTGSIDGVSSIAGELTTKKGNRILVVLVQNGVNDKTQAMRWEETVIQALYDRE